MAKRKVYDGDIPFDVWGNLAHSAYPHKHQLKEDQLKPDGIYVPEYDSTTRSYNLKKIFWSPADMDLEIYPAPKANYVGGPMFAAQMNSLVMIPNYEFHDTLNYKNHYKSGNSTSYFTFVSQTTGREYTFFLKDFETVITKMVNGAVQGDFVFCKRGRRFGTRLVR